MILVSQELEPLYERFRGRFPRLVGSWGYGKFMAARTFLLMGLIRSLDCYRDVGTTFRQWGSMVTRLNLREALGSFFDLGLDPVDWIIIGAGCLLMATVSSLSAKRSVRDRLYDRPVLSGVLIGALVLTVLLFGAYSIGYDASQFIYNQF